LRNNKISIDLEVPDGFIRFEFLRYFRVVLAGRFLLENKRGKSFVKKIYFVPLQ
jgi:hypothetical protein